MGRPSKLTDKQWEEIGERLLKGEKAADLAREYGVSKPVISARFSKRTKTVKSVANQIVATEEALRALPLSEQVQAVSLAEQLRSISNHLAGGANYGAATFHRLAGIAHAKVQEIDDAAPLNEESREALRDVAVLTKMANDAAVTPLNLLAANRETVKQLNAEDSTVLPVKVAVQVEDAGVPEPAA
jgi:hypothetical protein